MYKKIIELSLLATFVACTPVHTVEFQSDPPGAVIYCQEKRIGFAPIKAKYTITPKMEETKELLLKDCRAQWISGAEKKAGTIKTYIPQAHYSKSSYLFLRPDFPNHAEDERFAMEREKVRAMNNIAKSNRKSSSSFNEHDDDHHHRDDRASMRTPSSSGNTNSINRAVESGLKLVH